MIVFNFAFVFVFIFVFVFVFVFILVFVFVFVLLPKTKLDTVIRWVAAAQPGVWAAIWEQGGGFLQVGLFVRKIFEFEEYISSKRKTIQKERFH